MKKAMLGIMALVISFSAIAQEKSENRRSDRTGVQTESRGGGEKMFEELNLSETQKSEIKAIYEKYLNKIKELRSNSSLSAEARKQHLETLRKEQDVEISALLTTEQKAKWIELKEESKSKGKRKSKSGNIQ